MSDDKPEAVPVLFEQCMELYEAMAERASMQPLSHASEEEGLVYEGFLTRLVTDELHYSVPYYSKMTQQLKAMDCIHQLQRGGSTTPSRWLILQPPTLELFKAASGKPTVQARGWRASIEQQIRDLTERISQLEQVG